MVRNNGENLTGKVLRMFMAAVFASTAVLSPWVSYAQALPGAAPAATGAAAVFAPPTIRGIKIRPNDPLTLEFIVDSGSDGVKGEALKAEMLKMAKFFLAAMTMPEKDMWVNLSPYEKDRVLTEEFGNTDLGREMLAQDAILKKMSSSIVDPSSPTGQAFWANVYAKVKAELGDTEVPLESMQKIWITPDIAKVYQVENAAILGETRLKVKLDEDQFANAQQSAASDSGLSPEDAQKVRAASLDAMRNIVIPAIEKEVNEGKEFAPLRQFYGAIILAVWYKSAVKESVLSKLYVDQRKVSGVEPLDLQAKDKIYQEYVDAFKKGAFNFIHEDADPVSGQTNPKKYFTGGITVENAQKVVEVTKLPSWGAVANEMWFTVYKFLTVYTVYLKGVKYQVAKAPVNVIGNVKTAEQVSTGAVVPVGQDNAELTKGGLDFNDALNKMMLDSRGDGVKVYNDPAMIDALKALGLEGFLPVVQGNTQVDSILAGLKTKDRQ